MRRYLIIVTLIGFTVAWGWLWWSQQQYGRGEVRVGETTVAVDVAASIPTLKKGLSGRESLPDGTGMLLVFSKEARHPIWMKGMLFSIDILWILNGEVVDIAPSVPAPADPAQAHGLSIYEPRLPADMVLEVPAGFAARYGVKIGDPVQVRR